MIRLNCIRNSTVVQILLAQLVSVSIRMKQLISMQLARMYLMSMASHLRMVAMALIRLKIQSLSIRQLSMRLVIRTFQQHSRHSMMNGRQRMVLRLLMSLLKKSLLLQQNNYCQNLFLINFFFRRRWGVPNGAPHLFLVKNDQYE